MSKVFTPKKRKWFSNIVLASFLILVVGTMFLSNVFKTPIKGQQELIEQALVFSNKELENVTRLSLKNKSGEFTFERADTETSSAWHMTSPRDISVNSVFVEKLFSSLNIIKTKNSVIYRCISIYYLTVTNAALFLRFNHEVIGICFSKNSELDQDTGYLNLDDFFPGIKSICIRSPYLLFN